MRHKASGLRSGVYVDVENIARNGGRGMRFDVLRDYACRDGAEAIRLNAYLAFDEARAQQDVEYRQRATRYHFALRDVGFKVIEKPVRWYTSEEGVTVSKANSDLDLAVDLLLQSAKLDRVVLSTGDGDFVQVVRALQNSGCRVELVAFQNVSYDLRCEVDLFLSGYLIPGLLPSQSKTPAWGEVGSRVRGTCYHYNADKGFGFLRYLARLGDLSLTDTSDADCPYQEAFFHRTQCPPGFDVNLLPSRDTVFEGTLHQGREGSNQELKELVVVGSYTPPGLRSNRATRPADGPRAEEREALS